MSQVARVTRMRTRQRTSSCPLGYAAVGLAPALRAPRDAAGGALRGAGTGAATGANGGRRRGTVRSCIAGEAGRRVCFQGY